MCPYRQVYDFLKTCQLYSKQSKCCENDTLPYLTAKFHSLPPPWPTYSKYTSNQSSLMLLSFGCATYQNQLSQN